VRKAITVAVGVVIASDTGGARASGRSGFTGKLMASTAGAVQKASADAVGVVPSARRYRSVDTLAASARGDLGVAHEFIASSADGVRNAIAISIGVVCAVSAFKAGARSESGFASEFIASTIASISITGVVLKAITGSVGVVIASDTGGASARGDRGITSEFVASSAGGLRRAITDSIDVVKKGGTVIAGAGFKVKVIDAGVGLAGVAGGNIVPAFVVLNVQLRTTDALAGVNMAVVLALVGESVQIVFGMVMSLDNPAQRRVSMHGT